MRPSCVLLLALASVAWADVTTTVEVETTHDVTTPTEPPTTPEGLREGRRVPPQPKVNHDSSPRDKPKRRTTTEPPTTTGGWEVPECPEELCQPPDCRCASQLPPLHPAPQLVMLSFDDAVNTGNFPFYQKLLNEDRRNRKSQCLIGSTFFVTHEYTDYRMVHQLYTLGAELAVHSITHSTETDLWRLANQTVWTRELSGMRDFLARMAKVPREKIRGVRAPFLQTAGDTSFSVLHKEGFLYDASMPSRMYVDPPLWPYTLDHSYQHDCQIPPCPRGHYPGLWVVPLVNWFDVRRQTPCAMVDACMPYPETVEDTFSYLRHNFDRHYLSNRAPLPVFLHESWLKHPNRTLGYLKFVDWMLEKDDVFLVTVQDALDYIRHPVPLDRYREASCLLEPREEECGLEGQSCGYLRAHPRLIGPRFMGTCIRCPRRYPWVDWPLDEVPATSPKRHGLSST
ncbi:Cda9 [Cordylochernes scorpioides]|uniref:Cda9 n=1 Tax=Cordylochernes scorpioides TaxID=51811 RepID=A0ABY6LHF0_9ARAC|nr:Cda9 [Cordylochernes scorpioides]